MILNIKLGNQYFNNSDSLRCILYEIVRELSNIEIDNTEIPDLLNVYQFIDDLITKFDFHKSLNDIASDLDAIYNESTESITIPYDKLNIYITKVNHSLYCIESVTYNYINNKTDDSSLHHPIEIKFDDESVKPDIESVIYGFIKSSDILSKLDKYVFKLVIRELMDIFNIFKNVLIPSDLNKSLGAVYYTMYHANDMHVGSLDSIHISRGYIDINICRKHNTRYPHYYVDSIVINDKPYPELNFITNSINEFRDKLNINNKSMDKYIPVLPLSEFKNAIF